jgi:hypothetical protein
MGRGLEIPAGIAYDDLRIALAAIEHVHGDGEMPGIPVRLTANLPQRGQFSYDRETGALIGILVRSNQRHRAWSFAHEVGYYLDLVAIGSGSEFGSSVSPATIGWNEAVGRSRAFRSLLAIWERGAAAVQDGDGLMRMVALGATEMELVGTLLLPEELFARSYAQYVAIRSADEELQQSLDAFRESPAGKVYYPVQWQDEDFIAIAQAIDELFVELGWRS